MSGQDSGDDSFDYHERTQRTEYGEQYDTSIDDDTEYSEDRTNSSESNLRREHNRQLKKNADRARSRSPPHTDPSSEMMDKMFDFMERMLNTVTANNKELIEQINKSTDEKLSRVLNQIQQQQQQPPPTRRRRVTKPRLTREEIELRERELKIKEMEAITNQRREDRISKAYEEQVRERQFDESIRLDSQGESSSLPEQIERDSLTRFVNTFPEKYELLREEHEGIDPDFNRRFTYSIAPDQVNVPYFVPYDNFKNVILINELVITPYVWQHLFSEEDRAIMTQRMIITEDYRRGQLAHIIERERPGMTAQEFYNLTVAGASVSRVKTSPLGRRALAMATKNLIKENVEVPHDPNMLFTDDTMLINQIEGVDSIGEGGEKLSWIKYRLMGGYAHTYRVNTHRHVTIQTDEEMVTAMAHLITKMTTYIHDVDGESKNHVLVSITCYYTKSNMVPTGNKNEPPPTRKVTVYRGKKVPLIANGIEIRANLMEQLESQGSDAAGSSSYTLDTSYFDINIIDLLAGGTFIKNMEELDEQLSNRRNHRIKLPWADLQDYESKEYGCFIKILHVTSKVRPSLMARIFGTEQPYSYLAFWKKLDAKMGISIHGQRRPITVNEADAYAKYLELKLEVYSAFGEILFESDQPVTELPHGRGNNILRVVLYNDHYILIVRITHTMGYLDGWCNEVKYGKLAKKEYHIDTLPLYHDYETVFDNAIYSTNSLIPYSVAWRLDPPCTYLHEPSSESTPYTGFDIINPERSIMNIVSYMMADIVEMILSPNGLTYHLRQRGEYTSVNGRLIEVNIVGIAYNGSRFDNHITFRCLSLLGNSVLRQPLNVSRLDRYKFKLYEHRAANSKDVIMITYSVWDPCLYIGKSLREAAIDYKLPIQKEEWDHDAVQSAYDRAEFNRYMTEEMVDKLREYNTLDVELVRQLSIIVSKSSYDLTTIGERRGLNVLRYPTLPSFSVAFFKSLPYMGQHISDRVLRGRRQVDINTNVKAITNIATREVNAKRPRLTNGKMIRPLDNRVLDSIARRILVGGRVECIQGVHGAPDPLIGTRRRMRRAERQPVKMDFVMIDVVSLYSYAMVKCRLPIGELLYSNLPPKEVRKYYNDKEYVGAYLVRLDFSNVDTKKHPHSPIAYRDDMGTLHWDWDTILMEEELMGPVWCVEYDLMTIAEIGGKFAFVSSKNSPDEGVNCLIWKASEEGDLGGLFVALTGAIKNEEDRLRKTGSEDYNPARRASSKAIMNSVTGKLVQREYETTTRFFSDKQMGKLISLVESLPPADLITADVNQITSRMTAITYKRPDTKPKNTPHVMMVLYSFARYYIYMTMLIYGLCYYMDTDSGILARKTFNKMAKGKLPGTRHSIIVDSENKLFGQYEIEVEFDTLIVLGPKSYACIKDNEIVKYRLKGIDQKATFEVYKDIPDSDSPENEWISVHDNVMLFFTQSRKYGFAMIKSWVIFKNVVNGQLSKVHHTMGVIYGDHAPTKVKEAAMKAIEDKLINEGVELYDLDEEDPLEFCF